MGPDECGTHVTDGKGNELHSSPIPFEGRNEEGVFIGLLVELNVAAEVHAEADLDDDEYALFLSKEVGSGEGAYGTPLAYMRSGAMPCPASNSIWVSPRERTQSGMWLASAVHSAYPAAAERHQWLYLGPRETSVCRLRWTSSDVGRGANPSCGGVSVVGGRLVFSEVGESDSMGFPMVMSCVPVSAMTSTRSGDLWRTPPP